MSSNYVNICRVCMKEDENFVNLYSADTDFLEFNVKLFFCIPTVNIDNLKFPQKLCHGCMEDLRIAYKFKQTCLNSTYIINEILKSEEKKNRINDEETTNASKESDDGKNIEENPDVTSDDIQKSMTEENIDVIDTYKNEIEEHFEDDHTYFIKNDTDLDQIVTSNEMETNEIIQEIHREIKKEVDEDSAEDTLKETTYNPIFPSITEPTKKRSSTVDYFYCSICDIGFTDDDFKKHKYIHRKDSIIRCPKCDRNFENPKQIRCFFKHYCIAKNQQKILSCTTCNRFFKSTQALANHKKIHNVPDDVYECQLCDLVFQSAQKLDWHYRNGVHVEKNTKKIKIYDNTDE